MRRTGAIDYVELPGGNLAATKAFYAAAFGWTFQDYGPSYAAMENAGLDGGFDADPVDATKLPLVILYAEDLDAAQAAVIAAGGTVLRRLLFPGGERFHFHDPAGNELAVWTDNVQTSPST